MQLGRNFHIHALEYQCSFDDILESIENFCFLFIILLRKLDLYVTHTGCDSNGHLRGCTARYRKLRVLWHRIHKFWFVHSKCDKRWLCIRWYTHVKPEHSKFLSICCSDPLRGTQPPFIVRAVTLFRDWRSFRRISLIKIIWRSRWKLIMTDLKLKDFFKNIRRQILKLDSLKENFIFDWKSTSIILNSRSCTIIYQF